MSAVNNLCCQVFVSLVVHIRFQELMRSIGQTPSYKKTHGEKKRVRFREGNGTQGKNQAAL